MPAINAGTELNKKKSPQRELRVEALDCLNHIKKIFSAFWRWELNIHVKQDIEKGREENVQKINAFVARTKLDTGVQISLFYFFILHFKLFRIYCPV